MAAGLGNGFSIGQNLSLGRTNWPHVYSLHPEIDGSKWLSAVHGDIIFIGGTWTVTRNAGGNYSNARTAGASTSYGVVNLNRVFQKILGDPTVEGSQLNQYTVGYPGGGQAHIIRGMQIVGFDMVYSVATAGLTSLTPLLYQTTFADKVAPAINAAPGGAITTPAAYNAGVIPVGTNAQPYVVPQLITTPYIIGANNPDIEDVLEIAFVCPGTAVLNVYGINLYFNYTFL